jgi:hypoxanthine phosphoribosyltransferase
MDVVLFDRDTIQYRLFDIAKDIMNKVEPNDDIVLLCVLRGSYMFFTDLARRLPSNITIDFIQASSYGNGTISGELTIELGKNKDYSGKKVFIVDDIVDSGNTLLTLKSLYKDIALEVYTVALIARNESKHLVDFYGFVIGDEWIWGYGMDLNGKHRNIESIMYKEQNID